MWDKRDQYLWRKKSGKSMGKAEPINMKDNATVYIIETNQLKHELSEYSVTSGPRLCGTGKQKKIVTGINFPFFAKLQSETVTQFKNMKVKGGAKHTHLMRT